MSWVATMPDLTLSPNQWNNDNVVIKPSRR